MIKNRLFRNLATALCAASFITGSNASCATDTLSKLQGYTIPFARSTPVIDGKLDEQSWNHADFTTAFLYHDTGKPAQLQTHAKLLYDNECLYLGVETEDEDIYARYTHNADPLFLRDDLVEIFIDAQGNGKNYFEIGISASGYYYAMLIPEAVNGRVMPTPLSLQIKTATTLVGTLNNPADKDKKWTLESCIPISELRKNLPDAKLKISTTKNWRIGLFRIDYDHNTPQSQALGFYAWQHVGKFGFHRPERFGHITFGKQTTKNAGD